MRRLFKKLAPLTVLTLCGAVSYYLMATAPEPRRRTPKSVVPVVEVLQVEPVEYRVRVSSSGIVAPRTQSRLVSEVAGRILRVASNFRNGGLFQDNEVLIEIAPAEYRLALTNSEAALQGVRARMAELKVTQENLKKSLIIDNEHLELTEKQYQRHQRLQKQGSVAQSALEQSESEYLLRKASVQSLYNSLDLIPVQHNVLESELILKQAQFDRAQLDLQRTHIRAPYAGRVLEKEVDIGQSVSKGSTLASIYAVDYAEIRLPITEREASFLTLSKVDDDAGIALSDVILSTRVAGQDYQWQGRIIRSEGTIDAHTRQLFLVAQVDDPYSVSANGSPPLKVGQFIEAEISGRLLRDIFLVPREALRTNNEVLVVTPDKRIERRQLDVIWKDKESVVVGADLHAGEHVSLTALPYAPDGSKVKTVAPKSKRPMVAPEGAQ